MMMYLHVILTRKTVITSPHALIGFMFRLYCKVWRMSKDLANQPRLPHSKWGFWICVVALFCPVLLYGSSHGGLAERSRKLEGSLNYLMFMLTRSMLDESPRTEDFPQNRRWEKRQVRLFTKSQEWLLFWSLSYLVKDLKNVKNHSISSMSAK